MRSGWRRGRLHSWPQQQAARQQHAGELASGVEAATRATAGWGAESARGLLTVLVSNCNCCDAVFEHETFAARQGSRACHYLRLQEEGQRQKRRRHPRAAVAFLCLMQRRRPPWQLPNSGRRIKSAGAGGSVKAAGECERCINSQEPDHCPAAWRHADRAENTPPHRRHRLWAEIAQRRPPPCKAQQKTGRSSGSPAQRRRVLKRAQASPILPPRRQFAPSE